jgi:hypothetical protein
MCSPFCVTTEERVGGLYFISALASEKGLAWMDK